MAEQRAKPSCLQQHPERHKTFCWQPESCRGTTHCNHPMMVVVICDLPTLGYSSFYGQGQVMINSALHPSGVAKSSTSFGWGKGGNVTSAGWQVTLCEHIWYVSSRSGDGRPACKLLYAHFMVTGVFAVHGPIIWNDTPRDLRSTDVLAIDWKHFWFTLKCTGTYAET